MNHFIGSLFLVEKQGSFGVGAEHDEEGDTARQEEQSDGRGGVVGQQVVGDFLDIRHDCLLAGVNVLLPKSTISVWQT
ncbi:hypothetical protein C0580_00230 [Candidatus Parcubacteria bacterium]|nr:MAG: hypothetical protein C0580_00230 [Candidatus Parcubacteria bacterium]